MRVDVLTIFPALFEGFLSQSLIKSAQEKGLLEVHVHDFRNFADGVHKSVDDKPFGGGPGMVLKPEPVFACLESFLPPRGGESPPRMLLPSPTGKPFNQGMARRFAQDDHLVILCSRYEGYDERIAEAWPFEEVSLGDYVLMGGEVPAMALTEAIVRLRPGVLGHDLSALQDSFESPLLDHPHYTRPAEFRGLAVPEVLRSGDHAKVAEWRREQSLRRTRERRPDLLEQSSLQGIVGIRN